MTKNLAIVGVAACLCAVTARVVIMFGGPPRLDSKARKQWKEKAIAEIGKQTDDTARILKEIGVMKTKPAVESEWDTWISGGLIVMVRTELLTCFPGADFHYSRQLNWKLLIITVILFK